MSSGSQNEEKEHEAQKMGRDPRRVAAENLLAVPQDRPPPSSSCWNLAEALVAEGLWPADAPAVLAEQTVNAVSFSVTLSSETLWLSPTSWLTRLGRWLWTARCHAVPPGSGARSSFSADVSDVSAR